MRPTVWLIAGITLLGLLGFMWLLRSPTAPPASQLVIKQAISNKKEPKVPGVLATEEELLELLPHFDDRKVPSGFKIETVVKSGEPIVVDSYEGPNGALIFTKLTPEIIFLRNGEKIVFIHINHFSLSLDGLKSDIVAGTWGLESGGRHSINTPINDTVYSFTLMTEIQGTPPMIKIKADGSYEKRPLMK